MTSSLELINKLDESEAVSELMKCCGSSRWAVLVAEARPFQDEESLLHSATSAWKKTEPEDWLEAFSHHPKIGERKAEKKQTEQEREWSEQEQSNASKIAEDSLNALSELNSQYEGRFGYIFIVCATGKTADEMLGLLKSRLLNDPETELKVAAEEQRKIMELRLRKLVSS
jgi:2-oxo-4-hydroxy-4-carboxy-5-ureidoimidazoline decarboxylase